ncbi:MAG: phage tail protein [Caulobacteraceae bacterium]
MRDGPQQADLAGDDLALPDDQPAQLSAARTLQASPDIIRVRYIDGGADYQTGAAGARRETPAGGGSADLDLPIVLDQAFAESAAWRALRQPDAERDQPPSMSRR